MEKRPIATVEEWLSRLSIWVGGKWLKNGDISFRYYGTALVQIFEYTDRTILSLDEFELEFPEMTPMAEVMTVAFILLEPPTRFLTPPESESQEENS